MRQRGSTLVELPFALMVIVMMIVLLAHFTRCGVDMAMRLIVMDAAVKERWPHD